MQRPHSDKNASSVGKLRGRVTRKYPELVLPLFLPRQIDVMMRRHGPHVGLAQIRESSQILDTLLGSGWTLGPQHALRLRLLEVASLLYTGWSCCSSLGLDSVTLCMQAKVSALFVEGRDWQEAYRTLWNITPIYELCYPNKAHALWRLVQIVSYFVCDRLEMAGVAAAVAALRQGGQDRGNNRRLGIGASFSKARAEGAQVHLSGQ